MRAEEKEQKLEVWRAEDKEWIDMRLHVSTFRKTRSKDRGPRQCMMIPLL